MHGILNCKIRRDISFDISLKIAVVIMTSLKKKGKKEPVNHL